MVINCNTQLGYCIAQNFVGIKLWQIDRFMSFDEENVGKSTIANISYLWWMAFVSPNLPVSSIKILRYTVGTTSKNLFFRKLYQKVPMHM